MVITQNGTGELVNPFHTGLLCGNHHLGDFGIGN